MRSAKIKLGVALLILGFIGILALLMDPLPLDKLPKELTQHTPYWVLKILVLVNPTLMLIAFVVAGTMLHEAVNLDVPILKKLVYHEKGPLQLAPILTMGIIAGVTSGLLILLMNKGFKEILADEFLLLEKNTTVSIWSRLLYGGITEEILMRFGLMTLIVFALSKIKKTVSDWIYYLGMLIAACLFALGHFPVVFLALGQPSIRMLLYIFLGNMVAGILFGMCYWKKGLECAMVAHMTSHVLMIAIG
ncbi:MAG TPA: CPBP family intramembrane glutamic endopeptidase [Cytophagales bacterium]|nr:CPBP family intramembrane glutamic endopeptidase [Cytophagales bacterium]